MGGSEILLILLVILLLFGADKLPEFARSLGKGMREVKKATDEIKQEILQQTDDIHKQIDETKSTLTTDINPIDEMRQEIEKQLSEKDQSNN